METSELRIGNLFSNAGEIMKVEWWMLNPDAKIIFDPIKLTEKWLLKLGFLDVGNKDFLVGPATKHIPCFKAGIRGNEGLFSWGNVVLKEIEIKYIHQLQNIHFDLTYQELQIKALAENG
jgi:hypothetical protein